MRKGEIACYKRFSFSHNVFHIYISLVRQNVALCGNGLKTFNLWWTFLFWQSSDCFTQLQSRQCSYLSREVGLFHFFFNTLPKLCLPGGYLGVDLLVCLSVLQSVSLLLFSVCARSQQLLDRFCSNLILSQTTNFRIFQTERLVRQQFQLWWKWQQVFQKGRKHCWNRRNRSLWAISPFPTVFPKDLYGRHVKTIFGKG